MQDLHTIRKLNAEAHERDIPNQQAKGKYVVAEYHGLTYVGYSTHTSEVEANAAACHIGNQPGRIAKVYNPTALAAAVKRSEEAQGVHQPDHRVYESGKVESFAGAGVTVFESGTGGSFAGAGAESSYADTSTCDSDGGLTD